MAAAVEGGLLPWVKGPPSPPEREPACVECNEGWMPSSWAMSVCIRPLVSQHHCLALNSPTNSRLFEAPIIYLLALQSLSEVSVKAEEDHGPARMGGVLLERGREEAG